MVGKAGRNPWFSEKAGKFNLQIRSAVAANVAELGVPAREHLDASSPEASRFRTSVASIGHRAAERG